MCRKISIIGLGYVGLQVAVAFSKKCQVIAFDVNTHRIAALKKGHDSTQEVTDNDLQLADLLLTENPADLKQADFHIVAVPTPIDHANKPDLTPLLCASKMIGGCLEND